MKMIGNKGEQGRGSECSGREVLAAEARSAGSREERSWRGDIKR